MMKQSNFSLGNPKGDMLNPKPMAPIESTFKGTEFDIKA
jgi:hypothetical protein